MAFNRRRVGIHRASSQGISEYVFAIHGDSIPIAFKGGFSPRVDFPAPFVVARRAVVFVCYRGVAFLILYGSRYR